MSDSFIKIPEIKIDNKSLLLFVLSSTDTEWHELPWGQFIFYNWKNNKDIEQLTSKLTFMFSKYVNFSIKCMRFDSNKSLSIHKDQPRKVVIQIPLSINCQSTPTLFYNDNKELIDKIEWNDESAWMFNADNWHSVQNTSDESRYMLCVSFYDISYIQLLRLYKRFL
jgi:hypothetical protein